MGAAVAALIVCLTACGRGPVEPIGVSSGPAITIELFVAGQIVPSEGDYIIVLNENTGAAPNFININGNSVSHEQPGEPTIVEAYGVVPAPFTHWDQAIEYGSNPSGLPNCPLSSAINPSYCFKAVTQNGGGIVVNFIPITLEPGTFTFNPAASGNGGQNNAIVMRLPLACLSIFAGDDVPCGSVTQTVTQIYINFITLDTTGTPQDQLACLAGLNFTVDVSVDNTVQLTKPTNCASPPPSNQDLLITGGFVSVTGTGLTASPSPSPSPSPT